MKYTIYDSTAYEGYEDFIREEYPEIEEGSNTWWDILNDEMCIWYEDELSNLSTVKGDFIALADLGRWNGRHIGYKEIGYKRLDEAVKELNHRDYMDITFGIEDDNEFVYEGHHHDATDYITLREWRKGLSDEAKERFLDKVYEGTVTEKAMRWYTKSIANKTKAIFGWR